MTFKTSDSSYANGNSPQILDRAQYFRAQEEKLKAEQERLQRQKQIADDQQRNLLSAQQQLRDQQALNRLEWEKQSLEWQQQQNRHLMFTRQAAGVGPFQGPPPAQSSGTEPPQRQKRQQQRQQEPTRPRQRERPQPGLLGSFDEHMQQLCDSFEASVAAYTGAANSHDDVPKGRRVSAGSADPAKRPSQQRKQQQQRSQPPGQQQQHKQPALKPQSAQKAQLKTGKNSAKASTKSSSPVDLMSGVKKKPLKAEESAPAAVSSTAASSAAPSASARTIELRVHDLTPGTLKKTVIEALKREFHETVKVSC